MDVLESKLLAELAEFIGHIKSDWSARALVDAAAERGAGVAVPVRDEAFSAASLQALLRGKDGRLDAAAAARHFLAGLLFLCCAEAAPAAAVTTDDDMDVDVDAAGTQEDMDVDDGRPTPGARYHRQEEGSAAPAGSVAPLVPTSGPKRKRASGGGGAEVDMVPPLPPHKRRLLAWMRPHQWLPSGSRRVPSAPRRSRHARTVARAVAGSRTRPRRIGKPNTRTVALAIQRRRSQAQPSLGEHFSQITLSA